jgi:hypothetical protein
LGKQEVEMMLRRTLLTFAVLAAGAHVVRAEVPGRHPFYLHALSDLRDARWILEHRPGGYRVSEHESAAIFAIDEALREIRRAAIEDGKNVYDRPRADLAPDRSGMFHQALELLRRAHGDVAREEDDPAAIGLRNRAVGHIDRAIHETEAALWDAEHHR